MKIKIALLFLILGMITLPFFFIQYSKKQNPQVSDKVMQDLQYQPKQIEPKQVWGFEDETSIEELISQTTDEEIKRLKRIQSLKAFLEKSIDK